MPGGWAALPALGVLRLGGNVLSGTLPRDWCPPSMQDMDLSRNALTGAVPADPNITATLSDNFRLLLDGNSLSGTLPAWPSMPQAVVTVLPGNPGLCGEVRVSGRAAAVVVAVFVRVKLRRSSTAWGSPGRDAGQHPRTPTASAHEQVPAAPLYASRVFESDATLQLAPVAPGTLPPCGDAGTTDATDDTALVVGVVCGVVGGAGVCARASACHCRCVPAIGAAVCPSTHLPFRPETPPPRSACGAAGVVVGGAAAAAPPPAPSARQGGGRRLRL